MHVRTPDTHCHVIWPAEAHRDKPMLVPLHFAMLDSLDERQKSPFFFFVPLKKAGKGRGETKKICNPPQVSFSPVLGTAPRGFPVDEQHSFPAALEVHARGDNMAVLCCSKNDGRYQPAAGPQGNQCSFLTSHTCPWASRGSWESWGLFFQLSVHFCVNLESFNFSAHQFPDDSSPTGENRQLKDLPSLHCQEGPSLISAETSKIGLIACMGGWSCM